MGDVKYSRKYQPLFRESDKIRYKHMAGGRGSGKSHCLATYLLNKTYNEHEVILYTRWTMTSAKDSIIPEFLEKIELLNVEKDFNVTNEQIINAHTGSKILFKGINTSAGNQTAKLKSINGLTCFVLDEAEELVDESIFDKIDASIRTKDANNEVILVYNAPYRTHWIYKRFYEKRGYTDCFNGTYDDTIYIYTTYLDNLYNLDAKFLKIVNDCKRDDTEKYEHIYLGHFASHAKGLVYKHWKPIKERDIPDGLPMWYAIDFGFSNSHNAMVRCYWDKDSNTIYYHEIDYTTGRQPNDIATLLREDWLNKRTLIYSNNDIKLVIENKKVNGVSIYDIAENPKLLTGIEDDLQFIVQACVVKMIKGIDVEVICDSARPEAIQFLRENNINATSCIKGKGSIKEQIEMMKSINIFYTTESLNIAWELGKYGYSTKKDAQGTEYTLDDPVKMYDDLMDAARYGYCTPKICNLI